MYALKARWKAFPDDFEINFNFLIKEKNIDVNNKMRIKI
jgi:hypothetical protein